MFDRVIKLCEKDDMKKDRDRNPHPDLEDPLLIDLNDPDWKKIDALIAQDDLFGLYLNDINHFIRVYEDLDTIELAKSYKTVRALLVDWFGDEKVTQIFGKTKKDFLSDASLLRFRLILKNLRLVISVAKMKYRRIKDYAKVSFNDVVQAGNVGLIEAVERFDPDRGFQFSTYAGHWIIQAIYRKGLNPIENDNNLRQDGRSLLRQVYQYHERYVQEQGQWFELSDSFFMLAVYEYLKNLEKYETLSYEFLCAVMQASQSAVSIEGLSERYGEEDDGRWEERLYHIDGEDREFDTVHIQSLFSKFLSPEQLNTLYVILGETLPPKELESIQIWHRFGAAFEALTPENQVDDAFIIEKQKKLKSTYDRAIRRLKHSSALRALYGQLD